MKIPLLYDAGWCLVLKQKRHTQVAFARDLNALSTAMEDMMNLLTKESSDHVLDSRNIVDAAVEDIVQQIEQITLEQ